MNDRYYKSLLTSIKSYKDKGVDIIIRHDVDYDIHTLEHMLHLENEFGLTSITYFLQTNTPNCPYSIDQVKDVYKKYHNKGFNFGIHISSADWSDTMEEAKQLYIDGVNEFKNNKISIHSCTAHGYAADVIIPNEKLSNWDLEAFSNDHPDLPDAFHSLMGTSDYSDRTLDSAGNLLYIVGGTGKQEDSSKHHILNSTYNPCNFDLALDQCLKSTNNKDNKMWILFHPIHFSLDENNELYFTKFFNVKGKDIPRIASGKKREIDYFEGRLKEIKKNIPTDIHAVFSIKDRPIIVLAIEELLKINLENFTKKILLFDAGGGWGCLGINFIDYENIKYICNDLNENLIDIGKKLYKEEFDCEPQFLLENFYNMDSKDIITKYNYCPSIFCHLDYENGSPETGWFKIDYEKIYNFAKNFDYILISICKENCKTINVMNPYTIIEEDVFEKLFGENHDIVMKNTTCDNWRIVYVFKSNNLKTSNLDEKKTNVIKQKSNIDKKKINSSKKKSSIDEKKTNMNEKKTNMNETKDNICEQETNADNKNSNEKESNNNHVSMPYYKLLQSILNNSKDLQQEEKN